MKTPRLPVRDGVEDHHCDSAGQFLDALSPRNHQLWAQGVARWVFRGQRNAAWDLRPAAARDASKIEAWGVRRRRADGGAVDWAERRDMLRELLAAFLRGLDRAGLPIPVRAPDAHWVQRVYSSANVELELFPIMALAQHHGLPTMFLDWTRYARVAAYFAAIDSLTAPEFPFLAVWGLEKGQRGDEHPDLSFYSPPAATNRNLHAQAGLFTIHAADNNASLEEQVVRLRAQTREPLALWRVTLPSGEAAPLLALLSDEGVDGASMFPGPDGVARAMRERALWSAKR
jgi:hypothetical protein